MLLKRRAYINTLLVDYFLICCVDGYIYTYIYIDNRMHSLKIFQLLRIFGAVGTCLSSLCLTMKRGIHFTKALSSNDRRIHRHTDWWEEFMKYAVEMGSGVMMYILSFIKIRSGIQKLMGGDSYTQTAWCSHKPILLSKEEKQTKKHSIPGPMYIITQQLKQHMESRVNWNNIWFTEDLIRIIGNPVIREINPAGSFVLIEWTAVNFPRTLTHAVT
jgi:hypothetical protein